MGGETAEARRSVLDDLVARGLRRPEFLIVDGGKGLNAALLTAAVGYARDAGARLIEGYPVDTAAVKVSSNDLFHGALSTFVNAGFSVVGELRSGRPLVALDLAA